MDKRQVCIGVASLLAAWAFPAGASEEKILHVYNWNDYIAKDTIANFEKETGIKVKMFAQQVLPQKITRVITREWTKVMTGK